MIPNFNVGLLGHVDSGKTTLAKRLSTIASTAAFDKNPQSQQRGITLDLGFSSLVVNTPNHIRNETNADQIQFTFVDCPGHASLIRTIIGGAQIIDLIILVIDVQKGIQTQTAECIVLGEILQRAVVVVVNKIDSLDESTQDLQLKKMGTKLRKTFEKTAFGNNVPIYNISAENGIGLRELLDGISKQVFLPNRKVGDPFLMYVDHCFTIKGQGTICTGTIVQGQLALGDMIEIPSIRESRKVKSIQMFHQPVNSASMGDRIGLCVSQFSAKKLERGILTHPGAIHYNYAACISVQRIRYYKLGIKSKTKFHITIGHDTVMGIVTLFQSSTIEKNEVFDPTKEYEYIDELELQCCDNTAANVFAILQFEKPIMAMTNTILIASKLDLDTNSSSCRLAFWGPVQWLAKTNSYLIDQLPYFKIFKRKIKEGSIQRIVNDKKIIVQNLFKKNGNRDLYINKCVELSTGEKGIIEGTFGQTSKVQVFIPSGLKSDTLSLLKLSRPASEIKVFLKFKKYIFNKNLGVIQ